jgi:hypothetical protein
VARSLRLLGYNAVRLPMSFDHLLPSSPVSAFDVSMGAGLDAACVLCCDASRAWCCMLCGLEGALHNALGLASGFWASR